MDQITYKISLARENRNGIIIAHEIKRKMHSAVGRLKPSIAETTYRNSENTFPFVSGFQPECKYRRIFVDVIVYIYPHEHTTYLIEAVAVYMSLMQKLKELIKLSDLYNFQLFASSIEGNISHQKLRNCWVAKKLMSHTSL